MHLIKKLRIKIKNDRSHLKTSQDLISYIKKLVSGFLSIRNIGKLHNFLIRLDLAVKASPGKDLNLRRRK